MALSSLKGCHQKIIRLKTSLVIQFVTFLGWWKRDPKSKVVGDLPGVWGSKGHDSNHLDFVLFHTLLQLQDAFPWHGQWTPRHGLSKAYVLLGWMGGNKWAVTIQPWFFVVFLGKFFHSLFQWGRLIEFHGLRMKKLFTCYYFSFWVTFTLFWKCKKRVVKYLGW